MNISKKMPLVLLCGLMCDEVVWRDIKSELENDFDIQAFSFAGFDNFKDMANYILENTPEKFALAGHSMGGRVALEIVNSHPERVTHLGLLNTGVHPRTEKEVPGRHKLLDLAADQGMAAVSESWLPQMVGSIAKQKPMLMSEFHNMILRHKPSDFYGQVQALLNRPNALAYLNKIDVPTLLLSSDEDSWAPISQHEEMQTYIKSSVLVGISNAGHMSITEQPKVIAKHFREWLER